MGLRSGVLIDRSSSKLMSDWVVARLPAVINVITRSPGTLNVNIFVVIEKLSMPALVRVSDIKTMPLLRRRPMQ